MDQGTFTENALKNNEGICSTMKKNDRKKNSFFKILSIIKKYRLRSLLIATIIASFLIVVLLLGCPKNSLPSSSTHDFKLFISDSNQIRVYDLSTNKSWIWHEVNEDIVTFDVINSSVIYIEKNVPMIQSINILHNNVTFTKKVEPQALAVDFLTEKFYIIDKSARTVNVMDFEGKYFAIVLSDLDEMRDIILDVQEGFMFILQYKKSILRLNLDGTSLRRIVKNKKVTAMTLDQQGKKIFWTDENGRITVANYLGKSATILMESHASTIISLSFQENRLFWLYSFTHNQKGTPWTCKLDGNFCTDRKELAILLANPQMMKANADLSSVENKIVNPCKLNNGNCSDLCLLSPDKGKSCACRVGYELNSDLSSCRPVSDFIVFIEENYIKAVSINSKQNDPFKNAIVPTVFTTDSKDKSIVNFDYDLKHDNFYFYENGTIKMMKVRDEGEQKIFMHCKGGCYELTIDWTTNNLYYFSDNKLKVARKKPNEALAFEKVIQEDVHHFDIDVNKGQIFFTYSSYSLGSIYTNGSNHTSYSSYDDLFFKSSVMDYDVNALYFLQSGSVYCIDLNQPNEKTLVYSEPTSIQFINVHDGNMYFLNLTNIWRVSPQNTSHVTQIVTRHEMGSLRGMKVFSAKTYSHMAENECAMNNGGCDHFCFTKPQKSCGCEEHYQSQANGSCSVVQKLKHFDDTLE